MKNLLHPETKSEILSRIDALHPQSKPVWGKMNVNQNMRHLALALDIPLGALDPTIVKLPPMPKWLLKFFLLNTKPPKEAAETFVELNMVGNNIDPADFGMEKNNLKMMVDKFTTEPSFIPVNKMGGKFSKDDWGKLNYNHMDHHLRQFGV
jgi:hypothetical protein